MTDGAIECERERERGSTCARGHVCVWMLIRHPNIVHNSSTQKPNPYDLIAKELKKKAGAGAPEARAVQGQDTQRRARRRDCGFHADARGVEEEAVGSFFVHFTTINGKHKFVHFTTLFSSILQP